MARRRRWLSGILGMLIAALLLPPLLLSAALLLLQVSALRARAVSAALRAVNGSGALRGALSVGALEGDLLGALRLRDVALRDAEGQVALGARRLDLRCGLDGLLSLRRGRLEIEAVRLSGLMVRARPLRDGSLNLASLTRPAAEEPGAGGGAFAVTVREISVDGTLRYEGLPAAIPGGAAQATVRLGGSLRVAGADLDASLAAATIELEAPLRAHMEARGDLHGLDPRSLAARGLHLALETSGEALGGALPAAAGLMGPLRATLQVDGPGGAMDVALRLLPPRGAVELRAQLDLPALLRGAPDAWRGSLSAEGVDAAAAWRGAPRTDLQLQANLSGGLRGARVDLQRLLLLAAGARAELRGSASSDGALDARLELSAPDLAAVSGLPSLPRLGGRLSAQASLRREAGGPLRAQGALRGAALSAPWAGGASIDALELDLDTEDVERGEASLTARGVRGAGGALDEIRLHLQGSRSAAQLDLRARAQGAAVTLVAQAAPRRAGAALTGFDATLAQLDLAARGQALRLAAPARVAFQRGELLSIEGLTLGSGTQRLRLDGGYDLQAGEVRLRADAEHLDLGALAAALAPGRAMPATDLSGRVRVVGPLPSPLLDVELRGTSAPVAALGLGSGRHLLVARSYRDGVWGELMSSFAPEPARPGAEGPRLSLRADVPLSPRAPLFARLLIERARLDALRRLLPPAAAALSGEAGLDLVVEGSREAPQLTAALTVPRVAVGAGEARGGLRLRYDGEDLLLSLSAELGPAGRAAGRLAAQLQAPVGPALLLRRPERRAALLSAPLSASLSVAGLDLERLPLRALGLRAPPEAGRVDAALELGGSAKDPSLTGRVSARGVQLARGAAGLEGELSLRYQAQQARLDATLDQRPAGAAARPLLRLEGEAPLPMSALLGGGAASLRELPIHLDLRLPGYDLSALEATEGRAAGRVTIRGTLARPEAEATLALDGVRFDERPVGDLRLEVSGAFDGAFATARLALRQPAAKGRGGALLLTARVPAEAERPLEGTLRAEGLDLSALPAILPQLEELRGQLDGELRVAGTRARPRLSGALRARGDALRLDGAPFVYTALGLELSSSDGREVELRAQARSRGGSLADRIALLAQGAKEGSMATTLRVSLDGARPRRVVGSFDASHFPLAVAGASAWLDSKVRLLLERDGDTLAGDLTMDEGSLRVTRTESQEQVARAQPLRDVVFVDAEAAARRQRAAEEEAPPAEGPRLRIRTRLPQPFYLRGPEVDAEVTGRIDAELGGGQLRLLGAVRIGRGWIEISGQRYAIARATASFDGADLDPAVDLRLERDVKAARLVISVRGRASAPQLSLSAEPPVYDEAQLMAMIVSGGSGDDDAGRPADQRVLGAVSNAVSSAIVGQLKKQLGSYLPIEVLKLDLGFQGVTKVQPRLEVGKYITRRIYLSYVYQFGAQAGARRSNTHEAHLDLSILRNLSLVTLFGDAAVGAVKLYWTRRF